MPSAFARKSGPRPTRSQQQVSESDDPSLERLLTVISQDLIARLGQLRTDTLKTGQDGEIALINQLAAVSLNVTRTGSLLFGSAATGKRCGG
jgi:hypothetical protein